MFLGFGSTPRTPASTHGGPIYNVTVLLERRPATCAIRFNPRYTTIIMVPFIALLPDDTRPLVEAKGPNAGETAKGYTHCSSNSSQRL